MKEQNEPCATNNTKFSKSSTKGKYIGMDFNSLDDKFESVMEDKKDENHDHIDVRVSNGPGRPGGVRPMAQPEAGH